MASLLELIRDTVQSFFSKKFGESRQLSDPVQPDDFGPIIRELIDRGVIPSDFQDRPSSVQERILRSVPENEIAAAATAVNPMTTHREFMSVALKKCGNDQRTFRQLNRLWNQEKDTIRGMTKSELERELNCP